MTLNPRQDQQISPLGAGLALAGVFIVERIILAIAGIRFNIDALSWYWQILDPVLLREQLFESVFFLHAQPPLFNLVVGIALKLASGEATWLLHGLFLCLGLGLALVLFVGLLELNWPPRTAALAVAVAALTPGWIVYEHWLFYDFPVLFFLAVACVALLRFARMGGWGNLGIFVSAVATIALTRSLFHLVWVVVSIGILLVVQPRLRVWRAVTVLLLPVVLVAGWYAKNQVIFGFFGPSSWLGLSLAKTATARLDPVDREALVSSGVLSPYALVKPFSPLERYEAADGRRFPDSEIGVLGQRVKSSGSFNFNHRGFVDVSARCRTDALEVIVRRPAVYVKSVGTAARRFFSSAVAFPPFLDNLVVMAPVFQLGEKTWSSPPVVVASFLGALLISVFGAFGAFRQGRRGECGVRLWVIWTLVWVLVVGSLVEVGENHRFRFLVTPLVWLTLADAFRRLTCWLRVKS
ncbi:MAG: hypothetical protein DRJ61_09080 [Acidobacteria bacterium]|nr:MAG: hypothetical protein DRJ65_20170 [Acidobacteriota bacterium]RLE32611.1 MAG: hypothetical protein DRJ61_09080 [Acidobacteriota bacterium]